MNWYEKSKICGRYRTIRDGEKLRIYEFRDNPTSAEKSFWEIVKNNQINGLKFRRQHKIGQFIVDFYCHQAGLVVEIDGNVHDGRKNEDAVRTKFLETFGLKVVRFKNTEVLDFSETVKEKLLSYVFTNKHTAPFGGQGGSMKKIQILGTGCPKCKKLFEVALQAVRDAAIDAEVSKIEDINEILKFGVMMTPALVIDGEVKVIGRVPRPEEIKAMFI